MPRHFNPNSLARQFHSLCLVTALLCALPGVMVSAQDKPAPAQPSLAEQAEDDSESIIKMLMGAGKGLPKVEKPDYAPVFAEADRLIAKYPVGSEERASLVAAKAKTYGYVADFASAKTTYDMLAREFPGSKALAKAKEDIARVNKELAKSPEQRAAEAAIARETQALFDQFIAVRDAGAKSAADYTEVFAAIDTAIRKHPEGSWQRAEVMKTKMSLYFPFMNDAAAALQVGKDIIKECPDTDLAKALPKQFVDLERRVQTKAAGKSGIGKAAPALNVKWSASGRVSSLADLKGRVVVLDFFATWCAPCIAAFPGLRKETEHFRESPVSIISVTSIQGKVHNLEKSTINVKDDPAREMELMRDFMKKHDMTWDVMFTEEPAMNPAYGVTAIPSISIIAPDGTLRHAVLSPSDDIHVKVEAILREFNLTVPGAKSLPAHADTATTAAVDGPGKLLAEFNAADSEYSQKEDKGSKLEQSQAFETLYVKRRELLLKFLNKYPSDPRRWILVQQTMEFMPRFVKEWGEPDEKGRFPNMVVDETAAAAWKAKVKALKAEMKTAADLPTDVKTALAEREASKKKFFDARAALIERARSGKQKAEDYPMFDLSGRAVNISDYRGKVVILDWWATWCTPCVAAMPHNQEMAVKYRDQGLVVLAICTEDTREKFEKWVKTNQTLYPDVIFVNCPEGKSDNRGSKRIYNLTEIPTQLVVNREGIVVDGVIGYLKGWVFIDAALTSAGIKVDDAILAKAKADRKIVDAEEGIW
ncbi:MAG: redoxin domain-containing protein [Planctomycetota bacterium]